MAWLKPNMRDEPISPEQLASQKPRQIASKFPSPSEGFALDFVKQALALRDASQVDQFFRVGAVEPEVVIDFLDKLESTDGSITEYRWLSSMDANRMLMDGILVSMSKEDAKKNRLALLTPDAEGVWKIDYDAFARVVSPSWDEIFGEGNLERSVVRLLMAKDNYYNGPFSDDEIWESYGMVSPDQDVTLYGYCRKDSPQGRAMTRLFADSEGEGKKRVIRATLELGRLEDAQTRQFEIKRVLAEDWILSDEHFDADF